MPMKRLFFAIRPSPEILRELQARQQVFKDNACLKSHAKVCRWIDPKDLHMTLHFLGPVVSEERARIEQGLSAMPWPPACSQRLDHLVAFPKKPEATVAGIGGLNASLEELHMRMKPVIQSSGLILEQRRFYPHVTFVRFQEAVELVEPLPVFSLIDWPIQAVTLFESVPTPNGSRYEILREFPLAPA